MKIMNIGSRRELFWDDTIIDTAQTTAEFRLHHPCRQQPVMTELGYGGYCSMIHDREMGKYRIYYHLGGIRYAESSDGLNWEKPILGMYEENNSRENNIVFRPEPDTSGFDGFDVMIDPRPECPPDEKYKAMMRLNHSKDVDKPEFWIYISSDGYNFKRGWMATDKAYGDSLNTIMWDESKQKFRMFLRGFHRSRFPEDKIVYRDIRATESDDCRSWTDPQMLRYSTDTEYQMYTNNIMMYPRADHVLIGFPSRLTARYRWTANFDALCGRDRRWDFFEKGNLNTREPNDGARIALGISDTLFMTSRDTLNWTRYEEAFLSPGPENPKNWLYGGLYLAHGLIETPDIYPGSDNQYSMYCFNNRFFEGPAYLDRYTIRLDGFVSKHAGAREERVVTKPFIFSGREMYLNFATSGNGSVYIAMRTLDGQNSCETCELFGDSCNRRVTFTKFHGGVKDYRLDGFNEPAESSFADMEGKPVYLDIRLRDADIYSFKFE